MLGQRHRNPLVERASQLAELRGGRPMRLCGDRCYTTRWDAISTPAPATTRARVPRGGPVVDVDPITGPSCGARLCAAFLWWAKVNLEDLSARHPDGRCCGRPAEIS